MIPESRLIKSELTLREMSLPDEVTLARKSLVRWLALSFGLVLPNESRTLLLDLLDVLLAAHVNEECLTTGDILGRLEKHGRGSRNTKAVYYHLLKLRETGFLSRKNGRYFFGDEEGTGLREVFRKLYFSRAEAAFSKIDDALGKLEASYRQ